MPPAQTAEQVAQTSTVVIRSFRINDRLLCRTSVFTYRVGCKERNASKDCRVGPVDQPADALGEGATPLGDTRPEPDENFQAETTRNNNGPQENAQHRPHRVASCAERVHASRGGVLT